MERKANKQLTLSQKVDIINFMKSGKSGYEAAVKFNVSHVTIYNIKQDSEYYLDMMNENLHSDRCRRMRMHENEEINTLVWDWLKKMKKINILISGSTIKATAREFAQRIGDSKFRASNAWLKSFKKRYSINFRDLTGESLSSKLINEIISSYKAGSIVDDKVVSNEDILESSESRSNEGSVCSVSSKSYKSSKSSKSSRASRHSNSPERRESHEPLSPLEVLRPFEPLKQKESSKSPKSSKSSNLSDSSDLAENSISSYTAALQSVHKIEKFLLKRDPDLRVFTDELYKEVFVRAIKENNPPIHHIQKHNPNT